MPATTEAATRTAIILASNPHLPAAVRARILGRRPVFVAAKTHSITVDLRTGLRTVESTAPEPPKAAVVCPFKPRIIHGLPRSYFRILDEVAAAWELTDNHLVSPLKSNRVARPRFAAYWLIVETLNWSLPRIGRAFKRDHTTVLHGVRRAKELHATDADWRWRYEQARAVLGLAPL